MKLVLDEDIPRELARRFEMGGHTVVHLEQLGWKGIQNGELLRRISGMYEVLVTGDTNMPHQQNLTNFDIAIIQLRPRLRSWISSSHSSGRARCDPVGPKHAVTVIEPD
jgi:predicted nuclease of predicted toxin-antitoxin system